MTAQVALITGAGGGLGREVAAHLADTGWRLALHHASPIIRMAQGE
jgi:NAD(P)-dependent dehydrogenase (short-subunit alcohol dehydrogenase family)